MSSLWDSISGPGASGRGVFSCLEAVVRLSDLESGSILGSALDTLRGSNVLLATHSQLPTAIALVELDGLARRIVLGTPDLTGEQLAAVVATADVDFVLVDEDGDQPAAPPRIKIAPVPTKTELRRRDSVQTEWILLTSGTTGAPKLVHHTLESLGGALPRQLPSAATAVWSTFYDIRRYGGLQIFLRAVLSGTPLVLSSADEPVRDFLARAGAAGVTHMSGTPSHWRRALMSGAAARLRPDYVRLSGEIADQAVLDSLRATYPQARIAHAFASTEAGVAFEVTDGLAGFPADYVGRGPGGIDMKVEDGTLRIRSQRNASRYLGESGGGLVGSDGYVDTGDLVDLENGRYYFKGRKTGVINVGGLKVHPEEVEAVINRDPRVRLSLVHSRKNPITGAIVVADVVLADDLGDDPAICAQIKGDLLTACRTALPPHKVPAMLRFVPTLELTSAGKLVRPRA